MHGVLSSEAVVRISSVKKVFLKISQNSQKNTYARASNFDKVDTGVFSVNFLRTLFSEEQIGCLLLLVQALMWSLEFTTSKHLEHGTIIKYFQVI